MAYVRVCVCVFLFVLVFVWFVFVRNLISGTIFFLWKEHFFRGGGDSFATSTPVLYDYRYDILCVFYFEDINMQ